MSSSSIWNSGQSPSGNRLGKDALLLLELLDKVGSSLVSGEQDLQVGNGPELKELVRIASMHTRAPIHPVFRRCKGAIFGFHFPCIAEQLEAVVFIQSCIAIPGSQ